MTVDRNIVRPWPGCDIMPLRASSCFCSRLSIHVLAGCLPTQMMLWTASSRALYPNYIHLSTCTGSLSSLAFGITDSDGSFVLQSPSGVQWRRPLSPFKPKLKPTLAVTFSAIFFGKGLSPHAVANNQPALIRPLARHPHRHSRESTSSGAGPPVPQASTSCF